MKREKLKLTKKVEKMSEKIQRTVHIDKEVWRRFKSVCDLNGIKVSFVNQILIEDFLDKKNLKAWKGWRSKK